MRTVLCSLLSLLSVATAQLNAGTPGISIANSTFNGSRICNATFAQANITGVATLDPNVNVNTGDIHWAATVFQASDDTTTAADTLTELSLWFSPPAGTNYTDDGALGFDACYLWVSGSSDNTWARGQNDTGDCLQTLDQQCTNDLITATNTYSTWLVQNPDGNLTANALPDVCTALAQNLSDNFPASCKPFFEPGARVNGGPPSLGGPLTGNNSFVSRAQCTLIDDSTNTTYALMWSQFGNSGYAVYEIASYIVTPLITAFFPIASNDRTVTLAFSKSFMTCIRARDVNPGSPIVQAAPLPTPIDTSSGTVSNSSTNATELTGSSTVLPSSATGTPESSSNGGGGLSGGALAGIIVGAVLGVILAVLVGFFVFRRRKQDKMAKRENLHPFADISPLTEYPGIGDDKGRSSSLAPNSPFTEIGAGEPPYTMAELGETPYRMPELSGSATVQRVELPATAMTNGAER